jgi:hypothetical protein
MLMRPTRAGLLACLAMSVAVPLLGGCHGESGSFWSDDRYTFVSRSWQPKTVTLIDTRTGEATWSVDVPVDQQVVVGFSKGTGPNDYKPDEIVWEIMPADRKAGTRDSRMPCPGPSARRLEMTLRPAPEMPGTPLPGSSFDADRQTGAARSTRRAPVSPVAPAPVPTSPRDGMSPPIDVPETEMPSFGHVGDE